MVGSPSKRGSRAWAISDRSGFKFRMSEMVIERGTGFLVHRSEDDGRWNAVDHPQANLHKYSRPYGDPFPIMDARPDISWVLDIYLTDSSGDELEDEYGHPLEVG